MYIESSSSGKRRKVLQTLTNDTTIKTHLKPQESSKKPGASAGEHCQSSEERDKEIKADETMKESSFPLFLECKKQHGEFISIKDFTIHHLQKGCGDVKVFGLIKGIADLSVKVTVEKVSPKRPDFVPGTLDPYPFKRYFPEDDRTRYGTGRVHGIRKQTTGCPCRKCKHLNRPSCRWAEVEVVTAMHVVFDDFEARESSCRLFYDGRDSPEVMLEGHRVTGGHVKEDRCTLICVTCDRKLIDELSNLEESTHSLFIEVTKNVICQDNQRVIIVSHPHGQPKQISLGKWTSRKSVERLGSTEYGYDACTCPGSSGAYVFILGSYGWYHGHIHRALDTREGTNVSSHGIDFNPILN